jgi:ribosome biogenesis protein MAK21
LNRKPSLRSLIDQPEENDEENFVDIPSEDEQEHNNDKQPWSFDLRNKKRKFPSQPINTNNKTYDGRKRDPKYCNADQTCIWELVIIDFFFIF